MDRNKSSTVPRSGNLLRLLIVLPVGIFLSEVAAMILILFFKGPYGFTILLDATITTALALPLIFMMSYRPLVKQITERERAESIIQARLRLMQFEATHTLDELLQTTVDEIEALTGSVIGFFHFLEADQKTLWLQAWSTNTLQNMCKAEGKGSHYNVEQAGVWADCVRQLKPVIHNDYDALLHRKGMPEGHAAIARELAVPILRDEKVVAILGVGNKPQDYTASDVELVSILADFAWDIIERKRAEIALLKSEEKFRTLADWTYDWETWLNPSGNLVYSSPSCERITGYLPDEFIRDSDLLIRIVHPDDRLFYSEHHRLTHNESAGVEKVEYRVLARSGKEHWVEHICRPVFGADDQYLGRRVSNREITERKRAEREIREHSQKEAILTQTIHTIQTDIARDLHDTIGQNISFLRMNLAHLSEVVLSDQAALQIKIQDMTKAANESYELIRTMLAVLQAGNLADPLNLFTRYAEQVSERSSFQVDITSQGNPKYLSPHQMRQLFYLFREALSNIEKHANADRVSGEFIWKENGLTFKISDNGGGFEPDHIQPGDHYGLKFMRERTELLNGSFSIQSALGKGTTITVDAPFEEGSQPAS